MAGRLRYLKGAVAAACLLLGGCAPVPLDLLETVLPTTNTSVEASDKTPTPGPTAEPTPEPPPEPTPTAGVTRDPAMSALLATLILEDMPEVSIVVSRNIKRDCEADVTGCYHSDGPVIHLSAGVDDFRLPEMLAHEYLHHVWFRDDLQDDEALGAALQRAYLDEEGLGAVVPPLDQYFEDDGTVKGTELFSYGCTTLRPEQLERTIASMCARYLQLAELPVNQHLDADRLAAAINGLREEKGLPAFKSNPHAVAASKLRADTFEPYEQLPLDEYPPSLEEHLRAGCNPSKYYVRLTRPYDVDSMAKDMADSSGGDLTTRQYKSIGIAVAEFDFLDARKVLNGDGPKANVTLVVATLCK